MKFSEIDLHPNIRSAIDKLGFEECTPIQSATMPHILGGADIAGLAQTGTGKTAAFLLPLIHRVLLSQEEASNEEGQAKAEAPKDSSVEGSESSEKSETSDSTDDGEPSTEIKGFEGWTSSDYVLVLVPTRELAEQVSENFKKFSVDTDLRSAVIYGGTSYETQKNALAKGVQFVVATPGRLIDLYKEHVLDFKQVRAVVFDEADRMFDMGFKDDMRYVLRRIPDTRQMLLFSATLNLEVLNIAYEFGANPVEVDVSRDQLSASNVEDGIYHVGQHEKPMMLLSLLKKQQASQVIIFSNFKANISRLERFLNANGFPALGISSILSQAQRNRAMEKFKAEGGSNILVATDVAARGLDIKGVDLVINYELPNDAENYVHRIGRTGRAGKSGHALSLVSDLDVPALSRIEDYLQKKLEIGWLDDADLASDFKPFPKSDDVERRGRQGPKKTSGRGGGGRGGPRGNQRGSSSRGDGRSGPRSGSGKDGGKGGAKRGDKRRDGERRSEHRDRQTDRHREQGKSFDESRKKKSNKKRTNQKNSHHKKKKSRGPNQGASKKVSSAAKKPEGMMQKVSGFFKKLFK